MPIFSLHETESELTVTLEAEKLLTEYQAQELINATDQILEVNKSVLMDMAKVRYLAGCMLGAIVKLHQALKAADRKLRIENVRSEIMEVFKITQLHIIIPVNKNTPQQNPAPDQYHGI